MTSSIFEGCNPNSGLLTMFLVLLMLFLPLLFLLLVHVIVPSFHFGLLVWLFAVIAVYCCVWMLFVAVACLLADCSFCSFWLSIGCLVLLHLAGLLVFGSLLICLFASFLSSCLLC